MVPGYLWGAVASPVHVAAGMGVAGRRWRRLVEPYLLVRRTIGSPATCRVLITAPTGTSLCRLPRQVNYSGDSRVAPHGGGLKSGLGRWRRRRAWGISLSGWGHRALRPPPFPISVLAWVDRLGRRLATSSSISFSM